MASVDFQQYSQIGYGHCGRFCLFQLCLRTIFGSIDPRTDLGLFPETQTTQPASDRRMYHRSTLFGTDKLGRDIFRRVVHGGWNSLRVGIVAVGISMSLVSFWAYWQVSMRASETYCSRGHFPDGLIGGAFGGPVSLDLLSNGVPAAFFCILGVLPLCLRIRITDKSVRMSVFAGAGGFLGPFRVC